MTDINLGHILVILAMLIGFIMQYIAFSNRFSKFEGYTSAKLEGFGREVDRLWALYQSTVKDTFKQHNEQKKIQL